MAAVATNDVRPHGTTSTKPSPPPPMLLQLEAYEVNFPALKARLLDSNGIPLQEVTSAINDGQGNFVFTSIEPGTYRMVIGSDINGDNSWGGPGVTSGSSAIFEISDSSVSDL